MYYLVEFEGRKSYKIITKITVILDNNAYQDTEYLRVDEYTKHLKAMNFLCDLLDQIRLYSK